MKNNSKKIRVICLIWTTIGIVLLIFVWLCNYSDNYFMQKVITRIIQLYIFISCILSGVVARLSKNNK